MKSNMINLESQQQVVALTIDQAFKQAIVYHKAGHLQDAERLYRAILQVQPNHPEANHNLGVLAVQVNQTAAGLLLFKAALEAAPAQEQYWLSYADALLASGQAGEALNIIQGAMRSGFDTPMAQALRQKAEMAVPSEAAKAKEPPPAEINQLVTLFNAGQHLEVESRMSLLVEQYPDSGIAWKGLSVALQAQGKNALPALRKAAELSPEDAEAHSNLGHAMQSLGQMNEAVTSYRRALEIKPDYAEVHGNLGIALQELGRLDDAVASYCRALEIKPDFAEAHNNLGAALKELGRLDDAVASCSRALEIKPDYAEACTNLGNILQELGRFDVAAASHRRALEIRPDYAEAYSNLAVLLNAQGKVIDAFHIIRQSLQMKETAEAKSLFVACVKRLRFAYDDSGLRDFMLRAVTEPWCSPDELAQPGIICVKLNACIGGVVARAVSAWPVRLLAQDLLGANDLAALVQDTLLNALLVSAPICDIEMEHFLTLARHAMLETATGMAYSEDEGGASLSFYCAMARQCFINEYVFSYTDDEIRKASELRGALIAALEAKAQVPTLWVLAVAAYFPLGSLTFATRLLEMQWPEDVQIVLVQQIREPKEEQQLRSGIPRLTDIADEVSLLVQNQYEENPYPRWIKAAPGSKPVSVDIALRRKFPFALYKSLGKSDGLDILIAGCGTGQHPIGVAQQFQGARVLAVDLSMSSLAYAKRKTRELGLASIEYAQADLLKLGSLGRSFDVIESCGVLHHLAAPLDGWRALLSLLRPGGFMKLGFYSEVARQNIVRIRSFIAGQRYGATANEIRRCRQDLIEFDKSESFGNPLQTTDFFSISTCRDLLFHAQEHRMTLTGIDAFLRENNLVFMGFEIDTAILHAYKLRFPDDHAATNLGQWQLFENENPTTFFGMYQFWIQKEV